MFISVLIAVLFFGIIIFLHELGHFLAARRFGVTIFEFSIGMGPKIFSRRSRKSAVLYSLRALPIGGYVRMAGEDESSDDPDAFCNKGKFARFAILFAGAFMNLLLGFLLMLLCVSFSKGLYSNTIDRFLATDENGNAVTEYRGLCVSDELLKVDGTRLFVRYDTLFAAMRSKGEPVTLTVRRGGSIVEIEDFPFPKTTEGGEVYGDAGFFVPTVKEKTPFTVLHDTFFQTASVIRTVYLSIHDLITGRFGTEAVSGPVGVVTEVSESVRYGWRSLLFLIAMITINIGVFNLLPFPALDGGRIVFLLIEALIGRKVDRQVEGIVNFAGLMLLFALMLFVTFKDILKLFA